jgi:hypothetical protein
VQRIETDIDAYANDPGRWGASLANNAEFLFGCLDAAAPRSVVEVGAYAGDLTRLLLAWAAPSGARIVAIDPVPKQPLEDLVTENPDALELVRATSHVGLAEIELPDVAILDGDHNYFTVAGELRIIAERAGDGPLPLLLFHDVGWPHARRDAYEAPDAIPEEHRQPMVRGGGLFPGEPGIRPGALPMWASATHEGGPRNGVLTAIEDFIADREDLRLAIVPSFFGFGALWQLDAPYAGALAELLDPWDRNPILERLEANRVLHLSSSHFHMVQAAQAGERDRRKGELLQKLLISRSFAVGQLISRLRQRGEPAFSKDEITALLDER